MKSSEYVKNRLRMALRNDTENIYADAFFKLSEKDQEVVAECAAILMLANSHRLGVLGALEVLGQLGIFLNGGRMDDLNWS